LHFAEFAILRARDSVGSSKAARIAMIAITTNSSTSVKAAASWRFSGAQPRIVAALDPMDLFSKGSSTARVLVIRTPWASVPVVHLRPAIAHRAKLE